MPSPTTPPSTAARAIGATDAKFLQRSVDVRTEFPAGRARRWRQRSNHHQCASGQVRNAVSHQVTQTTSDPVADHRNAHGLADDKTHPGRSRRVPGGCRISLSLRLGLTTHPSPDLVRAQDVDHQAGASCPTTTADHQAEILVPGQPGCRGKHGRTRSGRKLRAAPATARGHDGPAGASAHAQPEPVLPGTAAVVRLESALALAHGRISRLLQAPMVAFGPRFGLGVPGS